MCCASAFRLQIRGRLSDTEFNAKVRAKVGPVSAGFTGKVTLSDLDPPNGYKISGEGQGGVAGFARGGADVRLKPDETGTGTILTYAVQANVGGKIAQIGSRLIEGTARSMSEQFFGNSRLVVARNRGAAAAAAPRSGSWRQLQAASVSAYGGHAADRHRCLGLLYFGCSRPDMMHHRRTQSRA
jgi:carbon monoxide dehydrogenase subunit G